MTKTSENISEYIEKQLDSAGEEYLHAINDTRPESTISMMDRLSPLLQYIRSGSTIVSIGIGQGEEICGLHELFGDRVRIIGIDISPVAIQTSKDRIKRNNFSAELIQADAIDLPLEDESVDAVILSSTLHEIFSYHPDHIEAFKKAISQVSRVLKSQGVLFIRDFAPLGSDETVDLQLRTPIANKFYDFFRSSFRRFENWGSTMDHLKLDESFLPASGNGTVRMPFSHAAEVILHFRSFWSDYQSGSFSFDKFDWKESDEMYMVRDGKKLVELDKYMDIISKELGDGFSLMYKKIRDRVNTNTFLLKHFALSSNKSVNLIPKTTKKIEMVFQKNSEIKKHYAAAVVFNEEGDVLICQRNLNKKVAPGMWHLPGGGIEFNEHIGETVERELKEELDLDTVTILPTNVTLNYKKDDGLRQTHVLWVEVSNTPKIMNEENTAFEFVSPDYIDKYIEPHLVADNLKAIKAAEWVRQNGTTM